LIRGGCATKLSDLDEMLAVSGACRCGGDTVGLGQTLFATVDRAGHGGEALYRVAGSVAAAGVADGALGVDGWDRDDGAGCGCGLEGERGQLSCSSESGKGDLRMW
jgi:hypothetical protein